MSIKIFCDGCGKEIIKNEGFGQLNLWKKVILFNVNKTNNPSIPQIQEQEFYLCVECCDQVLEIIKKKEP